MSRPQSRLDTGIDVLEKWADGATVREKNAVYDALCAMTDHTLFRSHRVIDDVTRLSEFFVLLPDDLVLKLRVHCFDSYGIVYIGPRQSSQLPTSTRQRPDSRPAGSAE
jgi:hypothetical protein